MCDQYPPKDSKKKVYFSFLELDSTSGSSPADLQPLFMWALYSLSSVSERSTEVSRCTKVVREETILRMPMPASIRALGWALP